MPDDDRTSAPSPLRLEVVQPERSRELVPELEQTRSPDVWVYRYAQPEAGWVLSIATHGAPGSGKLSLGGFRIAPAARADSPGYDNDAEAIGLALGMEEKVHWSRVIHAGGPLARAHVGQLVGGKCVLRPTADSRVGQPRDFEMLDWALRCFHDFERASGVRLNTGQDLGHGTMSDGHTQSLDYLGRHFHGCVFSNTSSPTAEGNFYLLKGMLDALDIPLAEARVGLVGCGNIGEWVLRRMLGEGVTVTALEARAERREALRAELGADIRDSTTKAELLASPIHALVVNANGGTLDIESCQALAANPELRVVCGSENLAMPDARGAEVLRSAGKVYAPTEFGGMMGYLTAVEEYYARHEGKPFDIHSMLEAARRLESAGREITSRVRESGFQRSFEEAAEQG